MVTNLEFPQCTGNCSGGDKHRDERGCDGKHALHNGKYALNYWNYLFKKVFLEGRFG